MPMNFSKETISPATVTSSITPRHSHLLHYPQPQHEAEKESKHFSAEKYHNSTYVTYYLPQEVTDLLKLFKYPVIALGFTFIALNIMFILIIALYTSHLLIPSWHWLTEGQIKLIQVLIYSILPSNE